MLLVGLIVFVNGKLFLFEGNIIEDKMVKVKVELFNLIEKVI